MITNEIKTPPHNEEAEHKLIACCLLDGDYSVYDTVSVIVTPDDFYTLKGKLLFTAIASLVEKGKPLDAISLQENLKASKGLDEVGGMAGIFSVMSAAETPLQAQYCAKLIAEKSRLRSIIRGCRLAAEQAESESAESQSIRASLENDILKIDTLGNDTFSVADSAEEILDDIQKMQDGTFNPNVVKTNLRDLDGYLGNNGIAAGEVLTLAAPTSCGKSALALYIATKALRQDDIPTAYFSFEMPRKQLMKRMIQTISGINVMNIQDGVASPQQEERFKAVTKECAELPLYTSHSVRNADDLTSQVRHLVRKKGVKLVVIDYLQLIPFDSKKMGKCEGIADISHKIKQMALDLNISVILLAQVNREGAKSERIRLYDLKDSGDIENDADVVLLMYPSKGDFESSKGHDSHGPYTELTYNVAKNREGQRDVGGFFKFYHCIGRFATMEYNNDIFSNDRRSQKRFVDWAYDKIAQEMERIEELEEEFGTAEYVVPSRTNKSPKNLSDDKKIETVLKIDKLREEGYSFKLASELCDIAPSTYTKWKRQFKTRLGKPSE